MGRRRMIDQQVNMIKDDEIERLHLTSPHQNEYGYDPFGFNFEEAKQIVPILKWFYRSYFRCKIYGIENVPSGRVMIVANHSGQLPFDGLNIGTAMLLDGQPPRLLRGMADRFVYDFPFLSYLFPRWGQILGTPDNCRRLLELEEAIMVFPEGSPGISKPFSERYQLKKFGLGFM